MWLFLAFLAVPLIEIALFIQVGGWIGLWPTLLIVVLTALAGTYLVRSQGAQAMGQLRGAFNDMRDPTEPLAHGAMILFSGALLLTPGFFTDAVGFALLVPGIRSALLREVKKRVEVQQAFTRPQPDMGRTPQQPHHPDIVEGSFTEADVSDDSPSRGSSGWTRH